MAYNFNDEQPDIELPENAFPPAIPDKESHDALLSYLLHRLQSDNTNRLTRVRRYATIDKIVSTWQVLSAEDSQRKTTTEDTGQATAISINLPLVHTHLDDMVSFFAGIYSPTIGDFVQTPESNTSETSAPLVKKLNGDAKQTKYYKNLTNFLRSILKYNVGGLSLDWMDADEGEPEDKKAGMNHSKALDMYNVFWDPSILDPADIRTKAEWAAIATTMNLRLMIQMEQSSEFYGVESIRPQAGSNGIQAQFYKYPPNDAGISSQDAKTDFGDRTTTINWKSYGASIDADFSSLTNSHEVVRMFCWLNPSQFDMVDGENKIEQNTYVLWEFIIANGERILKAVPVQALEAAGSTSALVGKPQIPMFMGMLNQDDMGLSQRSVAELMQGFQVFGSFLLNAHVASARGAIWGIQAYDPTMFDMGKLAPGENTARIPSAQPGRDVRSGLMKLDGSTMSQEPLGALANLMGIMKELFPSQAAPSQIAGMDRAVTSQVSAVLQGTSRRLHNQVRVLDDDILSPHRMAQYRNIVQNEAVPTTGLTDDVVARILGSGLQQLNKEAAEQGFRQLLFAIIQNPETASGMDVMRLMNYWGTLMNLSVSLGDFAKETPPATGDQNTAPPVVPGAKPTGVA